MTAEEKVKAKYPRKGIPMKRSITSVLLWALNSRWLNNSPCSYGFIGNVDAFSLEHLESTQRQEPDITLKRFLEDVYAFQSCPMRKDGFSVIEDGEVRDGTVWDMHELRESFKGESGNGRESD